MLGRYRRKPLERIDDRALTTATVPAAMMGGTTAGTAVTPTNALAIADAYACIRALADTAASLPLHLYRRHGYDFRERVLSGRPIDRLNRPSKWQRQGDLIGQTVAHLNTWGNAYWGKYRDAEDRVAQIGCLDPARVTPEIRDGEPVYGYADIEGRAMVLGPRDVTHIRLGVSMDGLVGLSPVRQAAEALGLSSALAELASRTALNDASPRGVLRVGQRSTPLAGTDDGKSTVDLIAEAWEGRHKGQPGRVAVVQGDVEFVPVSMPLAEMQFLGQREFSTREVARIFRVPPWVIGGGTADSLTYATVAEQARAFVTFSLRPILGQIEQAISGDSDLCPGSSLYAEFLLDELLRGDPEQRSVVYERGLRNGWLTVADVRRMENLPPLEPAAEPVVEPVAEPVPEEVPDVA